MADKSFGIKELNLIGASGTPTITSPNNLNLNASNVAISTDLTVARHLDVDGHAEFDNVNIAGVTTFVGNVEFDGTLTDYHGNVGAGTSVLISTGIGVSWATNTNLTRGTAQSLSGSSEVTFSSLPSGIRRITLLIEELSTTVNFRPRIRVGTGGAVETTGYLGLTQYNNVRLSATTEWPIYFNSNAAHFTGEVTIENITGNTWIQTHNGTSRDWTSFNSGSGSISLSGVLDTVSISLDSGTFDDGTINIFYEV